MYHYTVLSNYEKIKKEGLIPYRCQKTEINILFESGRAPDLIFLFEERLTGIAEFGSLLWQAQKGDMVIIGLKITKKIKENCKLFTSIGERVDVSHYGSIGTIIYHDDVPIITTIRAIKPRYIKLDKIWDLRLWPNCEVK